VSCFQGSTTAGEGSGISGEIAMNKKRFGEDQIVRPSQQVERGGQRSEIIIFEEIESKALDPETKNTVLFGEKDFIESEHHLYDLIFHARQTNPLTQLWVKSIICICSILISQDLP
jgi:hypothetical protein